MPFHLLHFVRLACLRHLVVWALLVALPVHSLSGVLQQVLGASHRHTDTADAQATQTLQDGLRALLTAVAGTGTLALIDHEHAREQAHRLAAERTARTAQQPITFSEADLRVATQASAAAGQNTATSDAANALPPGHTHAHHHDGFQRHVHDSSDGSVVALGDKAGTDAGTPGHTASADAGSGGFPLPADGAPQALAPAHGAAAWRHLASPPWRSHISGPLERPPQA